MREFATDRPDIAENPFTVDAGHVRTESDNLNYTRSRPDENGTALPPSNNLVGNGNLEQGTTGAPTGWSSSYWGNLKPTFTYPERGNGGGKAAKMVVTHWSSGDAKWQFSHVPVSEHTIYQFSDDYNSNVMTNVTVEYLLSNGKYVQDGMQLMNP
jgi:hypothetical protein